MVGGNFFKVGYNKLDSSTSGRNDQKYCYNQNAYNGKNIRR